MLSISFTHFVVGLIFTIILIGLRNCDAYSIKGIKNVENEAGVGILVPQNKEIRARKEMLDDEDTYGKIGRRKLMMKKEAKRTEENSSKVTNAEEEEEVSKNNSGASKLSTVSRSHMKKKKINPSGFMALNADYHMARPHPPKNN